MSKGTTKKRRRLPQCQAIINGSSRRCLRAANPGHDFCTAHTKARCTTVTGDNVGNRYKVGAMVAMMNKYGTTPGKLLDLNDELEVLKTYLAAITEAVAPKDNEVVAILQGGSTVAGYATVVGQMIERIERIAALHKQSINPRQIAVLANQIIAIINEEVSDPGIRQRVAERISCMVLVEG